jgi:hypothetical protein
VHSARRVAAGPPLPAARCCTQWAQQATCRRQLLGGALVPGAHGACWVWHLRRGSVCRPAPPSRVCCEVRSIPSSATLSRHGFAGPAWLYARRIWPRAAAAPGQEIVLCLQVPAHCIQVWCMYASPKSESLCSRGAPTWAEQLRLACGRPFRRAAGNLGVRHVLPWPCRWCSRPPQHQHGQGMGALGTPAHAAGAGGPHLLQTTGKAGYGKGGPEGGGGRLWRVLRIP